MLLIYCRWFCPVIRLRRGDYINEKNFEVDGRIGHCDNAGRIFGHSRIAWIIDTVLGEGIDPAAHEGHEDYKDEAGRLDTYRGFYGPEVDGASEVTAVHFEPLLGLVTENEERVTIVLNADEC